MKTNRSVKLSGFQMMYRILQKSTFSFYLVLNFHRICYFLNNEMYYSVDFHLQKYHTIRSGEDLLGPQSLERWDLRNGEEQKRLRSPVHECVSIPLRIYSIKSSGSRKIVLIFRKEFFRSSYEGRSDQPVLMYCTEATLVSDHFPHVNNTKI